MRQSTGFCVAWLAVACARSSPPRSTDLGDGPDGAALYARARESAEAGDSARAEQYGVAALARGAPERSTVRLLVQVCVAAGRLGSALRYAEPLLEKRPADHGLRYLVAALRFVIGDFSTSREQLETLLAADPSHAEAQYLLGVVWRDGLRDLPAARAAFAEYLSTSPDGPHAPEANEFLRQSARATAGGAEPRGAPRGIGDPRRRLPADSPFAVRAAEGPVRRRDRQ